MLHSRRYRNRRLGDFLKELDLTEGRSTGIPTIQDELKKNGSPRAIIETNDERSYINVFIPVHAGCGDTVILNDPKDDPKEISERQGFILKIIKEVPSISRKELTQKTGLSDSTLKRELANLKSKGYISRQGSTAHGIWIVHDKTE